MNDSQTHRFFPKLLARIGGHHDHRNGLVLEPQRAKHFIDWATGPVDQAVVDEARQKLREIISRLEIGLAGSPWLAGDTFTLAECAYAPFVDRLERLGFEELWSDKPRVGEWMARIKAHPAYSISRSPPEFEMAGPKSAA